MLPSPVDGFDGNQTNEPEKTYSSGDGFRSLVETKTRERGATRTIAY